MSKHLKKKFKRLWAKEKSQDMQELQWPAGDIDFMKTETKLTAITRHFKRNWVDITTEGLSGLSRHFKINTINQSEA